MILRLKGSPQASLDQTEVRKVNLLNTTEVTHQYKTQPCHLVYPVSAIQTHIQVTRLALASQVVVVVVRMVKRILDP